MNTYGNAKNEEETNDEKPPETLFAAAAPYTCSSWPGPRTVLLHRTENGFGFTLRHFIVYPPEKVKAEKDAKNLCNAAATEKRDQLHSGSLEPMDTIFVKQVKEGGAAHRAGLTTGDRIVSVNGETVTGKTYSDVVQLIQKKNTLQLLVVPREDDILQLYFPGTAYQCDVKKSGFETTMEKSSYRLNRRRDFQNEPSADSPSSLDSSPEKDSTSLSSPLQGSLSDQSSYRSTSFADASAQYLYHGNEYCPNQSQLYHQQSNVGNGGKANHQYSFPCTSDYTHSSNIHHNCSQRNHARTAFTSLQNVSSDSRRFSSENASVIDHDTLGFCSERACLYVPSSIASECVKLPGTFVTCEERQQNRNFEHDYNPRDNRWESAVVNLNNNVPEKLKERVLLSVKQKEQFLLNSNLPQGDSSDTHSKPTMKSHLFITPKISSSLPKRDESSLYWPPKTSGSMGTLPPFYLTQLKVECNSPEMHQNDANCQVPQESQIEQRQSTCNSQFCSGRNNYENDVAQKDRPHLTKVNSVPETGSSFLISIDQMPSSCTSSPPNTGVSKCTVPPLLRKANSLDSNIPPSRNHYPQENRHVMRLHLVSDRAKLFESGSLETESQNRLNLYRNELCRLTTKCQTPSVFSRAAQFESLSSSQDGLSITEETDSPQLIKKKYEMKEPRHSHTHGLNWYGVPIFQHAYDEQHWPDSDSSKVQGMSSSSPPPKLFVSTRHVQERKQNHFNVNEDDDLPRRKAVRQNSYLQAVQSPYKDALGPNIMFTSMPATIITAVTVTNTTTSLTTTNTNKSAATSTSESHLLCAGIVPERRAFFEDDGTYALQTKPNGSPVHMPADVSDNVTKQEKQHQADTLGAYNHNIQKLKSFFGEKTPQIIEAAEKHRLKETPGTSPKNIFKEGWLQCKIAIIEGKRSTDRSWKQFWASLRRTGLHMNKEKPQQYLSPNNEDSSVIIHPVAVNIASNYTKRKNVFKVATGNNSEYLLQADDYNDMQDWIHSLQQRNDDFANYMQLNTLHEEKPIHGLSPQPVQKGIKKLTSFRNRSPTNHSPVIKSRKTVHGDESALKSNTWKGKMVKTIRRIQGSSSSSLTVPEGITISIPLEDCPPSSTNEYVPLIVELCTSIVEARGLEMVGIYRVPGNTAAVTCLLDAVNKGFDQLNLQDPRWNDVNVISSVLKAFFRKLPDPLITSDLYPFFIAANKIEDIAQRLFTLKKLLHELPIHHYESIKCIIRHLRKVVAYSIINKMEARNLAIVFGPTLIRTADENMATMVTDMSHQCCIVETLINKAEWFFEDEHNFELSQSVLCDPPSTYDSPPFNKSALLNNVHKLEEAHAKDIIASVISAANRKVWHKTQKLNISNASAERRENFEERNIDQEVAMRTRHAQHPREFEDVLRSPTERTISDDRSHQRNSQEFQNMRKIQAAANRRSNPGHPWLQSNAVVTRSDKIGDEVVFRTYAGLSANTQERIRRFEMETRALLQRDLNRQRKENEQRLMEQQRVEIEWQRAKRELEQEDSLDLLADNLSTSRQLRFASNLSLDSSSNSSAEYLRTMTKNATEMNPVAQSCNQCTDTMLRTRLPSYFANRKTRLNFKALEKSFFYIDQSVDDEAGASSDIHTPSRVPLKDLDSFSNLRRGGSLESISEGSKSQPSSFAKRKVAIHSHTGSTLTSSAFGSLDSLHGPHEVSSCLASEEDDLLCSITSTLNQRLSCLKDANGMLNTDDQFQHEQLPSTHMDDAGTTRSSTGSPREQNHHYRDPSLHRYSKSNGQIVKEIGTPFYRTNFPPSADCSTKNQNGNKADGKPARLQFKRGEFHRQNSTTKGPKPGRTSEEKRSQSLLDDVTCVINENVEFSPGRNPHLDVQVHRNENTLIKATVSTTKQTITSSATTAVITATIVSTSDMKKPDDSDNSSHPCKISNVNCGSVMASGHQENDKPEISPSCIREKDIVRTIDSQASSSPISCSKVSSSHLRRRHTLGGLVDVENSRSALESIMKSRVAYPATWKRPQPCLDDSRLGNRHGTLSWPQRERLHRSFPNLTPVKLESINNSGFV